MDPSKVAGDQAGRAQAEAKSSQPLAGLTVIEISDTPAAAFAAVLLADFGARVIVCEPPGGSGLRRLGPAALQSCWWSVIGRNKESLLLDVEASGSEATLRRLLARAQIVVRDRPIPALAQAIAGLRGEPLDLYFHPTGADRPADWPWSLAPEFAEAASGVMALTGEAGGPPVMAELPLASHTTAMLGATAALLEIRAAHREARSPRPLSFALHEALMRMIEWQMPVADAQGRPELRHGNRFPMNSNIGNIFRTRDGTRLTISAATPSIAERLLKLIGGENLSQDPRFSSAQARREHMDQLEQVIAAWMADRDGEQALALMRAHDTVAGTIDHAATLLADPHVQARRNFIELAVEGEDLPMPAPMPTMKPLAGEVRFAGVEPGRDSATILAELHDGSSGPEQPRDMSGPEGLDQGSDSRERTNHATALSGAWTRPGLPLAGLRVVELGTVIAAPFAASLLADLGAEVIKIERPEGDPLRNMGLRDRGLPLWWATASRSKRLCTLDLKDPGDHAHFLSLIDRADVLIENNRPGVMQRLGLDWERLHARNPRLVMLSISGFGQTGPYASRPGFGKIAEAMSGIVELTGVPDAMPLHVGFSLADAATGLAGVLGIAQVLHERDVRGTRLGRQIDLALYEPLLRINECQAAIARMSGSAPSRQGSNDPWSFGRSGPADRRIASLRCADGQWVAALLDRPLETSLESLQHQLGRLERTEALRTLKTLSIEAVPVQDGFSLARERYFGRRGDTGLAVDARGIERPAPGVSPHGLGATARWSLSAAPLDPAERRTHWRD